MSLPVEWTSIPNSGYHHSLVPFLDCLFQVDIFCHIFKLAEWNISCWPTDYVLIYICFVGQECWHLEVHHPWRWLQRQWKHWLWIWLTDWNWISHWNWHWRCRCRRRWHGTPWTPAWTPRNWHRWHVRVFACRPPGPKQIACDVASHILKNHYLLALLTSSWKFFSWFQSCKPIWVIMQLASCLG